MKQGNAMTQGGLTSLCYSCLIDGASEHVPITLEEAAYTLRCWQEEGNELAQEAESLNAETFMDAWNHAIRALSIE